MHDSDDLAVLQHEGLQLGVLQSSHLVISILERLMVQWMMTKMKKMKMMMRILKRMKRVKRIMRMLMRMSMRMLKRMMFDLIRRMASLPDLSALTHRLGDQLTQRVLPEVKIIMVQQVLPEWDQNYYGSTSPARERSRLLRFNTSCQRSRLLWTSMVITFQISRDIAQQNASSCDE